MVPGHAVYLRNGGYGPSTRSSRQVLDSANITVFLFFILYLLRITLHTDYTDLLDNVGSQKLFMSTYRAL
jgi:hypothetical protein